MALLLPVLVLGAGDTIFGLRPLRLLPVPSSPRVAKNWIVGRNRRGSRFTAICVGWTACWPPAHDFPHATPGRLGTLRYGGRHLVGAELATWLIEAAGRFVGQR